METRPDSKMTTCADCGAPLDEYSRYCGSCGAPSSVRVARQVWPGNSSYRISTRRIILMAFLSQGMYLFYWIYFTRKQYLEHIYADGDPESRAFSFSTLYTHIRSLRDMLESAGMVMSINVGTTYLLIFTYLILIVIGSLMNGDLPGWDPIADWAPPASMSIKFLSVVLLSAALIKIQGSLNRFWDVVNWGQSAPARASMVEIGLAIWGSIAWSSDIATMIEYL